MSCSVWIIKTLRILSSKLSNPITVTDSISNIRHLHISGREHLFRTKPTGICPFAGYYNLQIAQPRTPTTTYETLATKRSPHLRLLRLYSRYNGASQGAHRAASVHGRTQAWDRSLTDHQKAQNNADTQKAEDGGVPSDYVRSTEVPVSKNGVVFRRPKDSDKGMAERSLTIQPDRASVDTVDSTSMSASEKMSYKNHGGGKEHLSKSMRIPGQALSVVQPKREPWQVQKSALSDKFGSLGWSPRKRLSPDSLEGIRALHAQYPDKFTTSVLADQFKVSPEAIRRILKSKWKPNEEEEERRRERWNKRGVNIWSQMNELGIKPPRKWRNQGVGKPEERARASKQPSELDKAIHKVWSESEGSFERLPTTSAVGREIAHSVPLAERIF